MPSDKENIGIIGYGITSIISVIAFAYGNSEKNPEEIYHRDKRDLYEKWFRISNTSS